MNNPVKDNEEKIDPQAEAIKEMMGLNEKPKEESDGKEKVQGKEDENKDEKGKVKENDDKKSEDKDSGDEKKDETLDKKEDKYSFIPEKFRVFGESGDIDIDKTLEKISKSYTHIESYSSRKNAENDKLKKEIESLKASKPAKAEEPEDEIIKKLYDDPKAFIQQLKEQAVTEFQEKSRSETESARTEQEKWTQEINDWIELNGAQEISKEMADMFSSLPAKKQEKFATGDIETMMEYLKAQVEINNLKKIVKYKPVPPKEESAGVSSPRVSAVKPKLDEIEQRLGNWFGLTDEEVIKAQNK